MSGSAAPKNSGRNAGMYTGPSEPYGTDWSRSDKKNQDKGGVRKAIAEAGGPAKSNPQSKHSVRAFDPITIWHEKHLIVANYNYLALEEFGQVRAKE